MAERSDGSPLLGDRSVLSELRARAADEATEQADRGLLRDAADEIDRLAADGARLRKILDHPDPHNFVNATEIEARFQMGLWGTEEGFPTAFDGQEDHHFAYLIGYLTGKVAASNEGLEKKLHRITTIGAAAANWHLVVSARESEAQR